MTGDEPQLFISRQRKCGSSSTIKLATFSPNSAFTSNQVSVYSNDVSTRSVSLCQQRSETSFQVALQKDGYQYQTIPDISASQSKGYQMQNLSTICSMDSVIKQPLADTQSQQISDLLSENQQLKKEVEDQKLQIRQYVEENKSLVASLQQVQQETERVNAMSSCQEEQTVHDMSCQTLD